MGTFTLKVDTDNEAFGEDTAMELCRILRRVERTVDAQLDTGRKLTGIVKDLNGNTVGNFTYNPKGGRK